ncbi:MAG: acyl-CoA dehydrogenase family protein, partial [Anaerolineae bacterium]
MIDFSLPDEAEALKSLAHRFAAEEIRPAAPALDEAEEMPWDLVRRAAELGIPAYAMPEEYGGGGFTRVLARCVVDEELYWGCAGIATVIGGTLLAATPILIGGTEDQKRAFLPRLCQAEPPCLGAFALTEPEAGSDPSGIRTRARRDGGDYVLDGEKCFITNGGVAGLYVVFATTDPEAGVHGLTAFVVDADSPGVTGGKKERKMGIRASHTAGLHFEAARVPAANRLGAEGQGFELAMRTLDHTRAHVAAGALGIARAAFEYARDYAGER